MRKLYLILALAVLALSGCAKPLEVGSITDIKSNTGSKSVDVYETKRAVGTAGVPEFAGDQLLEVRTYTYRDDAGRVELAGAQCELSGADFSARMVSPAKVRVPLYRGQSSQLGVSCEMPGYKRRLVTVTAIDVTRTQRLSTGANGGLIGLVAVSAIDAFSDNTKNDWRYPIAQIVLERDGPPPNR